MSPPTTLETHLPIEPILRQLHLMRGGDLVGTCLASSGYHMGTRARATLDKALERAITRGYVSFRLADQLCCHVLGLHPVLVYGEIWWACTDADELEVAS